MDYRVIKVLILVIVFAISLPSFAKKYDRFELSDGSKLEIEKGKLQKGYGYLILELNSDFNLKAVELSNQSTSKIAFKIKGVKKKTTYIIRLKEGVYSFSKVDVPYAKYYKLSKSFKFSVKAGQINYPGELVIRKVGDAGQASFVLRNRSFKFYSQRQKI